MYKDDFSPISLNVFLSEKVLVTYHHKHFESLNEVAKMNAQHHEPDLDCARYSDTYFRYDG